MKTLVTHINPHLDDIAGIWLFKKFHPDFKEAKVEFISASRDAAQSAVEKTFVGTGGGQFDEHKEGLDTCAGTLVYEYLKKKNYMPKDEILRGALNRLTEWNRLIDTGWAPDSQFDEFSVQAFIRIKDGSTEQFFTPSFSIDLKPIYDKVIKLDPEASWFLHQSHHMVICGSSSAPDSKPTKLSFEQLIEVAKSV